ncbi:MAG: hypothetical protein KOO60_13865 [Gemmatimonadales bacterium]|nr:hypothetical protein [Gemmatimonadales bacterium]
MRKLLLSIPVLLLVATAPVMAQCDLSPGFNHAVTVMEGNFQVTIGSIQETYAQGSIIEFEVVTTNIGTVSETISWPVGIPDALFVTSSDCADVFLCIDDILFSYPPWQYYIPGSETLAPGECRRAAMTWDTTIDPAPAGHYIAWGGLFAWTTDPGVNPLGEWILPANGVILPTTISSTVGAEAACWDQIKAHYHR